MPWSSVTLSTNESIAKINRSINDISKSYAWEEKIALAKQDIGKRLKIAMKKDGRNTDLEVISNPEIFEIASDYRVLYLIYRDLSSISEVAYSELMKQYEMDYYEEMKMSEQLYEIELNGLDVDGSKSQSIIECVR